MKTAASILAGLVAGVLVAAGILAALVFVGPDPVGLRPTPAPTLLPSASASVAPSASPSPSVAPSSSVAPSGSAAPGASSSPAGSGEAAAAFHTGQPRPLVAPRVGGGNDG
jgi:hypothetical protein